MTDSTEEAKRMLSEACVHISPNSTTRYPKAACDKCLTAWQHEITRRAYAEAIDCISEAETQLRCLAAATG